MTLQTSFANKDLWSLLGNTWEISVKYIYIYILYDDKRGYIANLYN